MRYYGTLREGDSSKEAECLAELLSTAQWKVKLLSNEFGSFAENLSKQNMESLA